MAISIRPDRRVATNLNRAKLGVAGGFLPRETKSFTGLSFTRRPARDLSELSGWSFSNSHSNA
jgi:hypothetical protein